LKMLVDSITPLIDRGFKVSASSVREKFGLPEPDEKEEVLMPTSAILAQTMPAAMNRQRPGLAINRVSKTAEAEMNDLTDEAMSDWEEVAEDFMNPIIELANASDSYETFLEKLPELQETLGADVFVEQMAQYMFQMRGYGDAKDV
ncbi:DUF935 family protein, partial [Vibrio europaeus]